MISFYDILPVSKENDNKYMKNKNRANRLRKKNLAPMELTEQSYGHLMAYHAFPLELARNLER